MINRQDEARGLTNRIIIEVKGKAKVGEAGIEKTQTAQVNEASFEEQERIELLHCPCGTTIRTAEEIGATDCCTNDLLCIPCGQVKCHHCHKSTGVESRIQIGEIYCKKCALKLGVFVLALCIVLIAVTYFVLFS